MEGLKANMEVDRGFWLGVVVMVLPLSLSSLPSVNEKTVDLLLLSGIERILAKLISLLWLDSFPENINGSEAEMILDMLGFRGIRGVAA